MSTMSPKPADPAVRTGLIEAAARVLAEEGPKALTTRRLAHEAGTSTMAVYTYFGSMDEVWHAVRKEGFARLVAHLDATADLTDPVAGLAAGGAAYLANGLANPHLYRAMFLERHEGPDAGNDTFQRLVDAVRRCVEAGRFRQVEPIRSLGWAVQLWTMRHGMVSLAIAELLPAEHLPLHFADMSQCLFVGYGDDPEAARRSVDLAMRDHWPAEPANAS
ncbi:TetR/AcrR family transcriptional regulator [Nonomuraea longispora]|uniref:TetR/AcrR family transcriptional regulator n=2 Tax=Nonomuraea longispora TaxID=1848320 RepID=A0A4R4NK25_9ACTN|nr:TetR/AcrR family transcriptional regulator [Nonomuraea longispora]